MRTVRAVAALRAALEPHRASARAIGLVPTMGALHEGHLSLIAHARAHCDVVVVSLFVNPSQFNERADLERYPRDERRDAELAMGAGADLLFAPPVEEVYPPGFATAVEVLGLTDRLEGAARGSEHFRGVTTVVTKLLCMCMPQVAYFGQKDAQQAALVTRLARDLDTGVEVVVCPTIREADGLALSSRNAYLRGDQRRAALCLVRALRAASAAYAAGERDPAALRAEMHEVLDAEPLARVDYAEVVDELTFLAQGGLAVLAVRIGSTRLIDNARLDDPP